MSYIKQKLDEAKAIAQKAIDEKREFTPDEQRLVEATLAEVKSAREGADRSKRILGELDSMAATETTRDQYGNWTDSGPVGFDGTQYLKFGKAWASKAAEQVMPIGQKALATGSSVFVDTELTPTPIPMQRPATSLLDILPVQQHGQPAYRYMRQSVRTNNAAVVADGATKPTSIYTIVPVDGSLSVVAHLSEAVPRYWFEDAASLKPFLEAELSYGLRTAVETKVLGDINGTSGIQTQAFATSPLITIRKSITKLIANGFDPTAIVVTPTDWETIELALATTTAVEYRGLPYDPVARRLYGVPVVAANIQAAGVAHVIASGAAAVDTDRLGVAIQWSETSNADDFAKNLVRARCEGRFGTSVYKPLGIVKAALAA